MPGMLMSICLAGALFVCLVDARDDEGMLLILMFIPDIPPLFFANFLLAAVDLAFDFDLPLDLLLIFMPGMFCMSRCARTGALDEKSSDAKMKTRTFALNLNPFITSPQKCSGLSKQTAFQGFALLKH